MSYINILQLIVIIIIIYLINNKKENFSPSQSIEIKRIKNFADMHKSGNLKVKNLRINGQIKDDLRFTGKNHHIKIGGRLNGHQNAIIVDNLKCSSLTCNSLQINNQNRNNNADRHHTNFNTAPWVSAWEPGAAISGTTWIYNGNGPNQPDNRFTNRIKYGQSVWG